MAKIGVRARAVDLLGRQQIAGIPTAVHELFKNAHDAYATHVEVDYFRKQKVFVLRDDGYGMTREDVESRWLTLGTESRVGANQLDHLWTGPKKLPQRPIMGEKGIGRLAIAVIAPITLLLTRAARPDGLHDLVVCLVHWGIFEQPGLNVQQINIPIKEFESGSLPTQKDISELVSQIRANIEELRPDLDDHKYIELNATLDQVKVDPEKLDAMLHKQARERDPDVKQFSLSGEGHGTHFILLPTAPEINDDIDGGEDNDTSYVEKSLLGFSNTMAEIDPPILTNFRDHRIDGTVPDLIKRQAFFDHDDLTDCDQYVEGSVNEFGQFNGTVRIYGQPVQFVCNWPGAKGRQTKCGSFAFKFGYLMGWERESLLDETRFKELRNKCDRLGGIYIYRDGIRILPYGNSDFDFLDVERRRAKAAKDAFFSYRRMVGYVGLKHSTNSALNEKAGREGFRQNQAYRDFRAILMNLLDRLAREFFRRGGDQANLFWELKDKFDTEFKAAEKQKKNADKKREELNDQLDEFFSRYEDEDFFRNADKIKEKASTLTTGMEVDADPNDYADTLNRHRSDIYARITELEKSIRVTKPAGLSVKGQLAKKWSRYGILSMELRKNIFSPMRNAISKMFQEAGRQIEDVYRSEQAAIALENRTNVLAKEVVSIRNEAYQATEAFKRALKETVKSEFAQFKAQLVQGVEAFSREALNQPESIESLYSDFESQMSQVNQEQIEQFGQIRDQMLSLIEDIRSGYTADTRAYIWEQRAEQLQEQLDFYEDYAQMGMGLGILQHEFDHVAADLRSSIQAVKPWASRTKGLDRIYEELRTNFESLDGYLSILDPIGRRIRRTNVELTGEKVYIYLHRLFENRMSENGIDFVSTKEFRSHSVVAKSSTILAAFTNIVDNAIYWLIEGGKGERVITLDADKVGYLIANNGPGIPTQDADLIFEFGETKKKGGSGIGLSISRSALRKEGFDLTLEQCGEKKDPVFRIHTVQGDEA